MKNNSINTISDTHQAPKFLETAVMVSADFKSDIDYNDYLRSKGFKTNEIIYLLSVRKNGVIMTKAIYDFNEKYDNQDIDGFYDSTIAILEKHYGKRLKKMKAKTIEDKIEMIQMTITTFIDHQEIKNAVKYYLS